MSRKKSREVVFRLLFSLSGVDRDMLLFANDGEDIPAPEFEYITRLYNVAVEHLAEIDKIISEHSRGFSFDRIFKTDLTALRMGIAEIKYTGINPKIAVNEAVEIAKKYGTEKSGAFVNGVLGAVL